MAGIKTPWFEKVDKTPLSEHPRPQFMRKTWQCLNGLYDYAVTALGAEEMGEAQGQILVPFAIESALSGVEKPLSADERLWYRRAFTVDDTLKGMRILLHFDAVDWACAVFLNGKELGTHTGGYDAFAFDITDVLTEGENILTLKVFDPTDEGNQQRGKQASHSHGFWYTGTSGIWQTVWLEGVGQTYIDSIKLLPDIDKSIITIETSLSGKGYDLFAQVFLNGATVAEKKLFEKDHILIPDAKLWSPETPVLYDLKLTLKKGDEIVDTVMSYFGLRKFSIAADERGFRRLCLNNKPYFQNGLLDQGYWCDGGMTPPTDEAMIFDIQKMKELGFNMLRKHIKVEPMRWYYHCDRLGMLVWQDMVSGGKDLSTLLVGVLPNLRISVKDNKYKLFSREKPEWREEYRCELMRVLRQLYNCPSICCWVPFNEGWGQFDAVQTALAVKKFDTSRFVDHASGWHDQGGPDFKSVHRYILPVTKPKADGRPFVLSEYGGYSYTIDGHVWNKEKSFGYIPFKSKESLSAAYKKLIEKQVAPLIKKGLCATVYTQVSDVEFEVNGILTYDRKVVKMDEETVKTVNAKLTY